MDDPRDEHILTIEEIEHLAKIEHDNWMDEKINTGWLSPYEALEAKLISQDEFDALMATNEEGCTDSTNNKIEDEENNFYVHANLIPYEELNSDSQNKDKRPFWRHESNFKQDKK